MSVSLYVHRHYLRESYRHLSLRLQQCTVQASCINSGLSLSKLSLSSKHSHFTVNLNIRTAIFTMTYDALHASYPITLVQPATSLHPAWVTPPHPTHLSTSYFFKDVPPASVLILIRPLYYTDGTVFHLFPCICLSLDIL